MEVENPGQIGEIALNDPELIPAMVASTVGQFQNAYDQMVRAGALLADEAVNGHNFSQWRDIDLRIIESSNSIQASDVYNPIQRARGAADDYAARIREIRGEAANRDLALARVLAYGGYSYVMLGEFFCESPVRADQGALTSQQILQQAILRFDEAIQVAQAFRAATPAQAARADSIINLSRVGAARAHLWIGNRPQAIQYASLVPANFEAWVAYSQDTQYRNNIFQGATTGASRSVGVAATFRNLNDPRVRHTTTSGRGHNGLTLLWDPFIGVSHGGYTATGAGTRFQLGTNMRFASGLEARYIVAEAQGVTADNLAFVNSRRAVGTQAPLANLTEAQYMAELRDQRRRDFFLAGHRLGDLRRYQRLYNLDLFPSGAHPNPEWGNYDRATCFVPSNAERVGNPNYRP